MNIEKLREVFPETTVYKDTALMATFKAAGIPAFLRDWILKRKADASGKITDKAVLSQYMSQIIPQRADASTIKDEARDQGQSHKFLAKISVLFNASKNLWTFEIPDLDFRHRQTVIEDYVWQRIKGDVLKTSGGWGLVSIGYMPPDKERDDFKDGRFTLLEYKNFCPYKVNLDSFRRARDNFTIEEWIDVLLGAIDYNPAGYVRYLPDGKPELDVNGKMIPDSMAKRTMLTRLLPFVEPRVNLLELAPKGTGKSYLFGGVGKYGWLVSGGTLSRAKMFRDMQSKQDGLVAHSTNE